MIVAMLVSVIGCLPKALRELIPESAGRLCPASAALGGRALLGHLFPNTWLRIASIINVPIGSFSKGMEFLVRIA